MKKNVNKISLLLAAIMCVASCGNNQVEETSDPLVNVTKEGLGYEVDGTSYDEEVTSTEEPETSVSETTTTSVAEETTENTSASTIGSSAPDVTSTTTAQASGGDYVSQQYENVYNTTVDKNLDNIRFGEIKIAYYKDGYTRFDLNDYFKDIDFTSLTDEDIKKMQSIEIGVQSETSTKIKFGAEPYDVWHYDLANIDDTVISSAIVTHRDDKEHKDIVDEYDINIVKDDKNKYEFKFTGTGHYLYGISDSEIPMFYLETEQDGYIIDPRKIRSKVLDDGAYISLKAISVSLGNFEEVTDTGYAKTEPNLLPMTFLAKGENKIYDIEVGMPFSKLTDILGEGEKLTEVVKSKYEGEDDITNEYYVYKTTDYTLVVKRTEYPDIKRPMFYDDTLPDKIELVSQIILIDNVTTSFTKPVEGTTAETSAATTVATEDTTTTKVEGEESNADTTTTVTA